MYIIYINNSAFQLHLPHTASVDLLVVQPFVPRQRLVVAAQRHHWNYNVHWGRIPLPADRNEGDSSGLCGA